MIEAVIFDMDGLMLDTERMALRAWRRASKEFGSEMSDELAFSIVGRNVPDTRAILQEVLGEDFPLEACWNRTNELYAADISENGIPLKPGLEELLDFLEDKSIDTAVATSTYRALATHKLELTGLISRFKSIVAGDEVDNGKPAPDIFLAAAKSLDAAPDKCVVLEDSVSGVRAAHAADMIPIMVPDLAQPADEIRSLAYAVVSDLHEAREVISQLLAK